jgi:hypothetical protein
MRQPSMPHVRRRAGVGVRKGRSPLICCALVVSTAVVAGALGCGGRTSGTGASTSDEGMTAASGIAAGSGSGAGGGRAGTITSAGTGSTTAGYGTAASGSGSSGASAPCVPTTCGTDCFDGCGNACTGGSCGSDACTPINSECAPGLICSAGQCRPQCASDVDCSGGTCISGVCRPPAQETGHLDGGVPLYHRATAATCPSQRGPNTATFPPCSTAPSPSCCSSDADCKDAGTNGRCFGYFLGPPMCSFDECFTDSECPSGTPCICRSSSTDDSPNTCVAGGNCLLDSDCGPGGYCSPSPSPMECAGPGPYYCHTSADTCTNDAECPAIDAGPGMLTGPSLCMYDLQAGHWACGLGTLCFPP